ncbi:MAG: uroporphyrinogen decarboxylase family protein [Actinomycetota bacterium]|nr:uroporphyrinogen decarboxylase family protein [Actinomycetota bacterium]
MKITKLLHPGDTMTAEERLQAAINLQVPDRVPSCAFIYYFAAFYAGITVHELWSEPKKYRMAMDKCYRDLGPWDVYYPVNPLRPELYTLIMPMKAKWPGIDLPTDSICQLLEEEIMKEEDYRWIIELARRFPRYTYIPFFMRMISRAWEHVGEDLRGYAYILSAFMLNIANWRYEFELMKRRGTTVLYSFLPEAAFDTFSLARGFLGFSRDLRRRPQEIAAAADALTEGYFLVCRLASLLIGIRRVEIFVHRSSTDFISPETFRKLSFPSLKSLVDKLVAAGITPILHCDGNWDMNLETLRELPAGNVVVQFDGPTDIFLAKRVIGDRICIMGDVPPDLLTLGSPAEVDEYCHRLIEEVGRGGGYIMGAGCEIPPNARPENVKAMLDSVVRYGYYKAGA